MRCRIAMALGGLMLGAALCRPAPAQAAQLDTVNLVGCAQEGGVCRMPYPTNVYYGVPGKTNGRPFPQGGMIPCNSQTFGDPAPGQAKSCWYAPRLTGGGGGGGGVMPRPRDQDYDDRRRDDYRDGRDYDRRRDDYRDGRDYDRPAPRRRYDEDDAPAPRRYREERDEY